MPIGVTELLVVLAVVLLILGPKRLPALGRQLGGGVRNLRDGVRGRGGSAPELEPVDEPEALDGEVVDRRT